MGHILNIKAAEQQLPEFRAVNPLGKVPTIRHGDAVLTEQVAISIYLADLFPEAGLAPAIGDSLRGPYLRWLVYYAASFEPAVVDKSLKREPVAYLQSPYGAYRNGCRAASFSATSSASVGRPSTALRMAPRMAL